ncbi:unnamed protein product, partial [Discosporangium mesarthrocarpum]
DYREGDGVDLEEGATSDDIHVGYIEAGEWLQYTVEVDSEDKYTLLAQVASPISDGSFRLVFGGTSCTDFEEDLTGVVEVPNTGSWQIFEGVTV